VLRVLRGQQVERAGVLGTGREHLGAALDEDVAEPPPVLVPVVDQHGDPRVLLDVADPLERPPARSLGFVVDGRVPVGAVEGVADRDDEGPPRPVRGAEPRHSACGDAVRGVGGGRGGVRRGAARVAGHAPLYLRLAVSFGRTSWANRSRFARTACASGPAASKTKWLTPSASYSRRSATTCAAVPCSNARSPPAPDRARVPSTCMAARKVRVIAW